MTSEDKQFQEALKRALDNADEALPADICNHLQAARKQALDARTTRRPASRPEIPWGRWLGPATGFAAAAVMLAVIITLWVGIPHDDGATTTSVQDMELLLTNDSLELYANLDFFRWLDATHAS